MRTIKFRAKSVEGHNIGEWVFGDLHIRSAFSHIHTDVGTRCKIDPNTIGEFTGLSDKNGKEIYEGDIVDAWSAGGHLPNGIIKWGEGIAGFFIMPPKCNAVWHLVGNDENKETLEVLGNIHDNPELLKGGIYEGN